MKRVLLSTAMMLVLSSMPGWAEGLPGMKNGVPERFSMLGNAIKPGSIPSNVVKAACTGASTCCCRAANQIFCSTPDACSRMGGACSSGCN